jgi:hypothetical protein
VKSPIACMIDDEPISFIYNTINCMENWLVLTQFPDFLQCPVSFWTLIQYNCP